MERRTGRFASFAVAFAFVSIATGIFTTYGAVLNTSGPVGIWTWPIAVVGQLAVAFVLGSLAARIPVTGYALPVDVAAGQPGPGLDPRLDLVHLPGHRRRRRGLHDRLDGPAGAARLTKAPRRLAWLVTALVLLMQALLVGVVDASGRSG